jgi:DNA topoisomerase II
MSLAKKKSTRPPLSKKGLAKKYQKLTPREHVLHAPDTYIGAVEKDEINGWIMDQDENMKYKSFNWIAGLYKCFDEGIVNARDHAIRLMDKLCKGAKNVVPVTNIQISVDKKTGVITMLNDGNGIDVAKHPEHKLWIPEMIFGHLRTSTNYSKDEEKIVGGKNGFGFKLVLIYSKWGEIETVDHIRGKKYCQRFENNLAMIKKPTVTKSKSKPYTKVSWLPDYEKFGIDKLTDDMFQLFKKRTFDIAAVTDRNVKVKWNDETIPVKTFETYIDRFIGDKTKVKRVYDKPHKRWEFACCLSPLDEFTQVSFVNGINTGKGGKHVEYILNQITKKMINYIKKKKKVTVRATTIKEQLMLFINCVIVNPAFDSQTKDYMNTPISKFGSRCEVSDKFIDKLAKMGVMDAALSLNEVKLLKGAKKTDGAKSRTLRGVPKLMDANYAGTSKSPLCTLILCEGDSAKAGIVSGLTKEDRNTIGVFPLKGKLVNTRDILQSKINNNQEIINIKKIIGLVTAKKYDNEKEVKKMLRYGKVLIMTDQDLDGSHIKGLCVNMFHSQWHDLIKLNDFLGFMNTPILKAKKGKKELSFYDESAYEKWKKKNNNGKGWKVKYYKGLGTSTSKEFKEYFANKKIVTFKYSDDCDNSIDKVFNKSRADDRKDWLEHYDKDRRLNYDNTNISYTSFIDKEMIHFSKYDCERSIPNLIDGWKTSQRKILYSAFKRNLVKEIKVAQFSGYVSENSCYHHGENSLNGTIIGMAQEFLGSNNVNVLLPNGQFGTRLEGGSDHASERYIFTALNKLTSCIFKSSDNAILNQLDDDGTPVEPEYYLPIIPMILVNGGKGIGTGFSYDGISYNPLQIMHYLKNKLKNETNQCDIEPYFEGFKGSISRYGCTINTAFKDQEFPKYLIKGKYKILSADTIQITELPIGTWTTPYKQFLETLMDTRSKGKKISNPIIKNYKDSCTDTQVDFTIKFMPNTLADLLSKKVDDQINYLEKKLKLYTTRTTSNMNLFNSNQQLKKYSSIYHIIDTYYPIRYNGYEKRKEYLIKQLNQTVMVLSNKARFIKEQCDDELDLRKKKKTVVIELLTTTGYDLIFEDQEPYHYLRKMPIDSVIEENYTKLLKEKEEREKELIQLMKLSVEDMWLGELDELEKEYLKYKNDRKIRHLGKKAVKKIKKKKK